MVSLKIQLLATLLLISEGYGQQAGCGYGYPQRCGSPTVSPPVCQLPAPSGPIVPTGQFIIPAMIRPMISPSQSSCPAQPGCSPSRPAPCAPSAPTPCGNADDDSDLDGLLFALLTTLIENRKCSGRRSGCSSSSVCDESSYCDDYDYGQPSAYCPPSGTYCSGADPSSYTSPSSCDNTCPQEINVILRPCPRTC